MNDRIETVSTSLSNSIVDTLDGNETDKCASIHIVKDALDKHADLINNKIPLEQLPNELTSSLSNDNTIDNLVAGSGITVTRRNGNVCISRAPSDESINDSLSKIRRAKLQSALHYKDICYCDDLNKFIAIASNSDKAITSSNGKDWIEITLPISKDYSSVTYNSKLHKICIVAKGNTNQFLISNDGVSFTIVDVPVASNYVDVVAIDNVSDGGMFVAVGDSGALVTSTDGTTWNDVSTLLPALFNGAKYTSITYSSIHRKLILVGTKGTIVESNPITGINDPMVFTSKNLSDVTVDLSDVSYSKDLDMYCAAISNNSNSIVVSKANESFTWTKLTMGDTITASNWIKVHYIPFYKLFMMVSESEDRAVVSSDGITWKNVILPDSGASGKYSSIASSSTINGVCMTIDGINRIAVVNVKLPISLQWINTTLQSTYNTSLKSVCWSPELRLFCAVGRGNLSFVSSDGITWNSATLPSDAGYEWVSVCWSPELRLFCAICYNTNKVATSPDGIAWTERILPANTFWQSICWSPNLRLFCAVANYSNKAATSPDGITWTERALPMKTNWWKICWSPELQLFCVLSFRNKIITSTNGIVWTERSFPNIAPGNWQSICWSPDLHMFCVCGGNNKVVTSLDGITWTLRPTEMPTSGVWYNICWSPELKLFCLIGGSTIIYTSTDSITWTKYQVSDSYSYDVCWSPELQKFCVVGGIFTKVGSLD